MNRLRWHLLDLCPELERSIKRGALNQSRVLDRADRATRKLPACARVRIAREQVAQIRSLTGQVHTLQSELLELVKAHHPQLLAEQGCGALVAAILIGPHRRRQAVRQALKLRVADRDRADSLLLRAAHRARLNRGGDRQLNRALHIVAISRAQCDSATKAYLAREEAEGKTTKGAIRSLKRHLARRVYQLLAEPPANQPQATNGKPTAEPEPPTIPERPRPQREVRQISTAPSPMVCIS